MTPFPSTALTTEWDEARRIAAQLRREAVALRLCTRRTLRQVERCRSECFQSYERTSRILSAPLPSPWSDLPWQPPDAELDQVLVLVPRSGL
jgi:hypothetical protein